jgi:hypothetical protein
MCRGCRFAYLAQYALVRSQTLNARKYGLEGTDELVNYCCVARGYGDAFDVHQQVSGLLVQVTSKTLTLDGPMKRLPHDIPTVDAGH